MQEIVVRPITLAEILVKPDDAKSESQEKVSTQSDVSIYETPQKSSSSRADI